MAYTQHFGLSRNSPLNMGGDNTSKEIETKIDTSPEKASSIIDQNNAKYNLVDIDPAYNKPKLIGGGAMNLIGGTAKSLLKLGAMAFEGSTGKYRPPNELKKEFDVERIKKYKL